MHQKKSENLFEITSKNKNQLFLTLEKHNGKTSL